VLYILNALFLYLALTNGLNTNGIFASQKADPAAFERRLKPFRHGFTHVHPIFVFNFLWYPFLQDDFLHPPNLILTYAFVP